MENPDFNNDGSDFLIDNSRLKPSPDVCFEEGLEKALSVIKKLLETKDLVIVAIEGNGPDSGKSYLQDGLIRELVNENVGCMWSCGDKLENLEWALAHCDRQRQKQVLIIQSFGIGCSGPSSVKSIFLGAMKQKGYEIDLWISIYPAFRPFFIPGYLSDAWPLGDIVIRNEGASIKRTSF